MPWEGLSALPPEPGRFLLIGNDGVDMRTLRAGHLPAAVPSDSWRNEGGAWVSEELV